MHSFFHRMPRTLAGLALAAAPLLASGCFVVDDTALNSLAPYTPVDAGTIATSENCGGAGAINIMSGDYTVANGNALDTRGAANDVVPICLGAAIGPEVFVQFSASAGQYWHFHVHPNNPPPTDGGAAIVADPILLLYQVNTTSHTCNTADCTYTLNRCPAGQDEHFGVEIPSTGTWSLGVDNATSFGSRYDLAVYRPTCGMFGVEHGEGCDDADTDDTNECDNKCRVNRTTSNLAESEPNEDRFWATHVWPDTTNTAGATRFVVTAQHTICDSDTFVVRLSAGESLDVRLKHGGTFYTPTDVSTDFTFTARTATGSNSHTPTDDGSGNAVIHIDGTTVTATTEYFVNISSPFNSANDGNRAYSIEFDVN